MKNSGRTTLKYLAVNGIGVALFVVLALCLRVPVFQNYYLCLGYVAMAVFSYTVGTSSGILVGTLGTILYCLLINGLRVMPGWAVGNIVIGFVMGTAFRVTKTMNIAWLKMLVTSLVVVFGVALGIFVCKSYTEVLLYAQPFAVRVASNMYAFVADAVVLLVSIPVCQMLNPQLSKIMQQK